MAQPSLNQAFFALKENLNGWNGNKNFFSTKIKWMPYMMPWMFQEKSEEKSTLKNKCATYIIVLDVGI